MLDFRHHLIMVSFLASTAFIHYIRMNDLQLYIFIAVTLGIVTLLCWLQDIFFPEENEDDKLEAESITMLWLGAFVAWTIVLPLVGLLVVFVASIVYNVVF